MVMAMKQKATKIIPKKNIHNHITKSMVKVMTPKRNTMTIWRKYGFKTSTETRTTTKMTPLVKMNRIMTTGI